MKLKYKKYSKLMAIMTLVFYLSQMPVFARDNLAFQRSEQLTNGINVSWLEQYWNPEILSQNKLSDDDFKLIVKLGFKTIRLPVSFKNFYIDGTETQRKRLLSHIDRLVSQCVRYHLKLILVNHYGDLRVEKLHQDKEALEQIWSFLELRYRAVSTNILYFELLNEPVVSDEVWLRVAEDVVEKIRKSSPNRIIIIGASNYNSIYELSRIRPLPQKNIIYTFHFYEPFIFTHQGADWIGKQVATIGIPFPYSFGQMPELNKKVIGTPGEANYKNYLNEGKIGAIRDKLQIVKDWSVKYQVPILCGEYGAYRKYSTLKSFCNYLGAVRTELKRLNIPGIIWDYSDNFSIFNGKPGVKNISPCMLKLLKSE